MKLKVKRLSSIATLPTYAHPGDAGLDLYAIETTTIAPHQTQLIPTGIAIELPPNTEAQVRPRSGLALKHAITVLNSPGTIDAGYRGEIQVILINHGDQINRNMPANEASQTACLKRSVKDVSWNRWPTMSNSIGHVKGMGHGSARSAPKDS
ncbi:MAG: dUTP diphosphatase, partial [Synechococcales cyanobacterium RU_4_20]|nr:dUTP diphosphatase [Synechococcales cyanobacterium RU_4_20]